MNGTAFATISWSGLLLPFLRWPKSLMRYCTGGEPYFEMNQLLITCMHRLGTITVAFPILAWGGTVASDGCLVSDLFHSSQHATEQKSSQILSMDSWCLQKYIHTLENYIRYLILWWSIVGYMSNFDHQMVSIFNETWKNARVNCRPDVGRRLEERLMQPCSKGYVFITKVNAAVPPENTQTVLSLRPIMDYPFRF